MKNYIKKILREEVLKEQNYGSPYPNLNDLGYNLGGISTDDKFGHQDIQHLNRKTDEIKDNIIKGIKEIPKSEFTNYTLDALSILAYIACPFTYGAGCAVSVAIDVLNAKLYIDKDDYYNAGMQMAFAIVPFGESLKWGGQAFKPYLGPIFKSVWQKSSVRGMKTQIAKTIKSMKVSEIAQFKKMFPKEYLDLLKTGLKTTEAAISKYFGYFGGFLTKMWTKCSTMLRIFIIFLEMVWYDPNTLGNILDAGGDYFGIKPFKTAADWLATQPPVLMNVWSNILASKGNIRGAITTTPYDCNRHVYDWNDVVSAFNGEFGEKYNWDPTDDDIWTEWLGGWRPDATSEGSMVFHAFLEEPEMRKKWPGLITDSDIACYRFIEWMESEEEEHKEIMGKMYELYETL